ncbi:MAG: DUF116 domain-containing protein [Nitrospirae bacterium]|nr:DUF116 domain-containing protein [Nitrospirota bacterium]
MTMQGKTYSLYGGRSSTERYYETIRKLTDLLTLMCPDVNMLLDHVQKAGSSSILSKLAGRNTDKQLILFIKKVLRESLYVYTTGVNEHLRNIPLCQKFDPVINTKEEQYHLYMIEIELINRLYITTFKKSEYKFALIAHCLKDFRPECRSVSGEIAAICKSCTNECLINLGANLLRKYDIHPYISATTDLKSLFKKVRAKHKSVGALGIACVPELVHGMRECIRAGISPVGIPIDANRCARWMKEAHETTYNVKELEELLK